MLEIAETELSKTTQQSASHHPFVSICDYFTSPEVCLIVHPKEWFVYRIEILSEGASNDEVLNMLSNTSDSGNIINKRMTHICM